MELKELKKQLKQQYGYSIQKSLSEGGTCKCYMLKNNLILKLFSDSTPYMYIEREFFTIKIMYNKCPAMFPQPIELIALDSDSLTPGANGRMSYGIIMERLEKININNLSLQDSVLLFYEIAEALATMRKTGFIHSDIKAENIMKKQDRFVLIDFGVSHFLNSGNTVRNPDYFGISFLNCPPESLNKNDRTFSSRGDIYSLAMTLRWACGSKYDITLAGEIERYKAENKLDDIIAIKNKLPDLQWTDTRFYGHENSYLLKSYCNILNTCTEPQRSDRYPKAEDLMTDLCRLLRS